jgi:hypothetical protein
VSEFTHDISIVATVDGLDPIELYATQTIADVEHFSRGVIDDANPEIPGTTGGVAGNRPDFLFVIAKGDEVQVELDNGDDMDVSLLKGQAFGMLSGKTFTRTTDAGDTEVSADAVGLNTVVGGRGATFEYLAVTKEVPDPCEYAPYAVTIEPTSVGTLGDNPKFGGESTSGYYGVFRSGVILAIVDTATYEYAFENTGPHCLYPCDVNGNPSGSWKSFELGDGSGDAFAVPDLSPLDGLTLDGTGFANGSLSFADIQSIGWTEITIPNLSGSSTYLEIVDSGAGVLTTVNIAATSKFKAMGIQGAAITSASVDALCNALDATATGQTSTFTGTAAATAASLANRLAYLVNNTLTFTP